MNPPRKRTTVPVSNLPPAGPAHKGNGQTTRLPPTHSGTVSIPVGYSPEAIAARKRLFLAAHEKAMCNVTLACEQSGIPRSTVYNWQKEDAEFKAAMEDHLEVRIDFAENALDKNISQGNLGAICFFLKTRAKHRGYVERHEISGPNGGDVPVTIRSDVPDAAAMSAFKKMVELDPVFAERVRTGLAKG